MATRTWIGNANPVAQIDTITVANTWATSDICKITVISKDLVVTVGSLTTTAQVAATIYEAIENITLTDASASVTPILGKLEFPELAEVTATVSGSVVTLEANTAGRPFTVSVTETTAGNGTATEATATAATGPNHFNNADNWTGATVPSSLDTIHFNQSARSDLLYGLSTGLGTLTMFVQGFTHHVGLSAINRGDPGNPYREYRETHLTTTSSSAITIDSNSTQSGRIFFAGASLTMNINATGQDLPGGEPSVQLVASSGVNGHLRAGHVGIGYRSEDTTVFDAFEVQGGRLTFGAGNTPGSSAAITQRSGDITLDAAVATSVNIALVVSGGTLLANGGKFSTITVEGGKLVFNTIATSGAAVTLRGDGELDFTHQPDTITFPTIERFTDESIVRDPHKRISSLVIDNNGCSDTSNLFIGQDCRITRGATS